MVCNQIAFSIFTIGGSRYYFEYLCLSVNRVTLNSCNEVRAIWGIGPEESLLNFGGLWLGLAHLYASSDAL